MVPSIKSSFKVRQNRSTLPVGLRPIRLDIPMFDPQLQPYAFKWVRGRLGRGRELRPIVIFIRSCAAFPL